MPPRSRIRRGPTLTLDRATLVAICAQLDALRRRLDAIAVRLEAVAQPPRPREEPGSLEK